MINIPKLFEGAIVATIKAHATDAMPRFRTWQRIDAELSWTATNDRVFPVVDVRATPPVVNEDGVTLYSEVAILVATHANDDPTHGTISLYYANVQTVLDALYAEFRSGTAGVNRKTFDAYIADHQPDAQALISVGGFVHGEPMAPYEDAGAYFIGLNFVIHFSRSDY